VCRPGDDDDEELWPVEIPGTHPTDEESREREREKQATTMHP
jgi:hypothetical protein